MTVFLYVCSRNHTFFLNQQSPLIRNIMRKFLLTLVTFISLAVGAQSNISTEKEQQPAAPQQAAQAAIFGYLSYDSVFRSMPDYATAMQQINELKGKYDEEAERAAKEFNKKYEEFLEGQRDFPPTILQKRQSELQELLDKNIVFKEESERLLKAAEKDIMAPLHRKLSTALKTIGEERGYMFIINTDNNTCPFVNQTRGEDITAAVKEKMK